VNPALKVGNHLVTPVDLAGHLVDAGMGSGKLALQFRYPLQVLSHF